MDNDLKALGLSWNEIKVYKSLLKLGETAVGGVINDLKIHRQIAYNALDGLEKRGMVERTTRNKVLHFKVADPDILMEEMQKKELIAKRLSQRVKKELKKSRREQEINIYNGQAGARKFYLKSFRENSVGSIAYCIGSSAMRHVEIMGEEFFRGQYSKLKKERKLYSKLIMNEAVRREVKEFNKGMDPKLREIRFLPFQTLNPVMTIIWERSVSFFSTGKDVFIIEIINKEFRDSYMDHFNMLWKIAKR